MDQDQLIKQVEWLDKERREDKKAITALQKKVAELEGLLEKSNNAIKESNSEITRLNVLVSKVDSFEGIVAEHRAGVNKELTAQEKRLKESQSKASKAVESEVDDIRARVAEFTNELEQFKKLHQQLADTTDDGLRRDRALAELDKQLSELDLRIEENKNAAQMIREDRVSSQKRHTDLAGEVSALRTKLDELRIKQEMFVETNRKTEARIMELAATEDDRRSAQLDFVETIARENEDREKTWKKWEKRFADIEEQAGSMTKSLESYGEAERAVQKAQKDLEKITEQINRRIHEITEMQRLGEERFRQEWNTFKADDQKRWANYALTQDEQGKETVRRFERLSDRATDLEELTQDLRDTVQHTSEQFEKLMQGVLTAMRDWMATTERYTDSMS